MLFVAGAGVSRPSKLPDFRGLVIDVYARLDTAIHSVLTSLPADTNSIDYSKFSTLSDRQIAEVKRYIVGDYDVVLGMLERRIDGETKDTFRLRQAVECELRRPGIKPAGIHRALMRLADRGGATTIATTNFDLLLEAAAKSIRTPVQTYSLGGIPRPGRSDDFAGVLHIHGALARRSTRRSDLIISDHDFGEFYLRRRVVPDFIYDAARLFNIVLVGYSANDPPMRYLLNAVAADGTRFEDLKERFAFIGGNTPDPVEIEDWKGRGITPIWYDSTGDHSKLLTTMERWAALSAVNGSQRHLDVTVKKIVKTKSFSASQSDKDLFDHIIRRSDSNERARLSKLISVRNADIGWLDRIAAVTSENERDST